MRYQVNAYFMSCGKFGDLISRERTGMSDEGLERAVESGRLLEVDEPDDDGEEEFGELLSLIAEAESLGVIHADKMTRSQLEAAIAAKGG
jgi:hypothetical protein